VDALVEVVVGRGEGDAAGDQVEGRQPPCPPGGVVQPAARPCRPRARGALGRPWTGRVRGAWHGPLWRSTTLAAQLHALDQGIEQLRRLWKASQRPARPGTHLGCVKPAAVTNTAPSNAPVCVGLLQLLSRVGRRRGATAAVRTRGQQATQQTDDSNDNVVIPKMFLFFGLKTTRPGEDT
jgi:hypothetical protein